MLTLIFRSDVVYDSAMNKGFQLLRWLEAASWMNATFTAKYGIDLCVT